MGVESRIFSLRFIGRRLYYDREILMATEQKIGHGLEDFILHDSFQMRIRIYNTNIPGNRAICYALTDIKGIGRSVALILLSKAGIPFSKPAGSLTPEEIEILEKVISSPDMPFYYQNCNNVRKTGEHKHVVGSDYESHKRSNFDAQLRLLRHRTVRLKKGLKNRGQKTYSNGRGIRQNL